MLDCIGQYLAKSIEFALSCPNLIYLGNKTSDCKAFVILPDTGGDIRLPTLTPQLLARTIMIAGYTGQWRASYLQ